MNIFEQTIAAAHADLVGLGLAENDPSAAFDFLDEWFKGSNGEIWVHVADQSPFRWEGWIALDPEGDEETCTRVKFTDSLKGI